MVERPPGEGFALSAGRILEELKEVLQAERAAIMRRDYSALAATGDKAEALLGALRTASPDPGAARSLAASVREALALRRKNLSAMQSLLEEAQEERRRLEREKLLLQAYRPGGEGGGSLVKQC